MPNSGGGGADAGSGIDGHWLMKPYPYQTFHYTDDLLHDYSRSWRQIPPISKQLPVYGHLKFELQPKETGSEFKDNNAFDNGRMESDENDEAEEEEKDVAPKSEITFENLNDFDIYKMANSIWPSTSKWYRDNDNGRIDGSCQHGRRHRFPLSWTTTSILYNENGDRGKRQQYGMAKKDKSAPKTSWLDKLHKIDEDDDSNEDSGVNGNTNDPNDSREATKKSSYPFKDDDVVGSVSAVISNSNNGNGNENLNYSDNMETMHRDNYLSDFNSGNAADEANVVDTSHRENKRGGGGPSRDKKPKHDLTTPYLPAISGGRSL